MCQLHTAQICIDTWLFAMRDSDATHNVFMCRATVLLHSSIWSLAACLQVIGVPDGTYGEEVCAWVRLHPKCEASAQELQQWCKENVAAFKIPRYWQFVDSYPLTASGKVQKYLMRQSNLSHATDCGKLYDRPKSGQVSFY